MAPESTGQQDLRTYARIFWRWKLLFLAFVVLIPLGVYLVERSQPKVYQSKTLIQLQAVSPSQGVSTPVAPGNVDAVARLVTTTPVANTAARLLHRSPDSLSGKVHASADSDTGFLTITARDRDPTRAAAIANAFAAALVRQQSDRATGIINQQIRGLQKQLASASRTSPGERVTLSQQLGQLRALAGSSGLGAQVVQAATPSKTPATPRTRRAVELALLIALLLGIGAVLIAENADRRLRTPEDVERLTTWPPLAAVPSSAFSAEPMAGPHDGEAFQMVRAALTYFNVDRPLRSVAIMSPQVGDGKTTVAVGLALATARAGKRAILVDADLRRPQVSERLGLAGDAGLGAVLAGERQLAEVMLEHPIESPDGGRLLVLPAGPPPPNPAALLGSERMRGLVQELEGQADLVVLDTVAALAVSDSLPLVQVVSGNVVIVRMNRTSSATVRRLEKMIASAKGTVLGVVATGSSPGAGYGAYRYYEDGDRGALSLLHLRRRRAPDTDGAIAVGDGARPSESPAPETADRDSSPRSAD